MNKISFILQSLILIVFSCVPVNLHAAWNSSSNVDRDLSMKDLVCMSIARSHPNVNCIITFINEDGYLITESNGIYNEYAIKLNSYNGLEEKKILTFIEFKRNKIKIDTVYIPSYNTNFECVIKNANSITKYWHGNKKKTIVNKNLYKNAFVQRVPLHSFYVMDVNGNLIEYYRFTNVIPKGFPFDVFRYMMSRIFTSFDHYPLGKEEIGRPTSNVDIHSQSHDIIQYCDSSLVLASINLQYHELLKKTMGYYTTNQDGNEEIYFYHGNHLGSASWITELHGIPIQYIHYLPYGEILANQYTTYNERFKFTGKELDGESGYYYFGARYLLSELGDFLSVDPLSNKAPAIQPYLYCNGNPLRYIDPDGRNPIYSPDGEFLGVNESGLQGEAFIMESKDYYLGMSNEDSRKLNQGINILSERARAKYESHFNTLYSRPDWDGILTLKEANSWYRGGSGEALYVDLKEIDLSGVLSLGERYVGQLKSVNLLLNSNSIENGLVYGNITLRRHPNNQVKAFPDTYNFEMHPWGNPLNWGRNLETLIGRKVAGTGVPYTINFYGSKTLTPLMPWLK